MRVGVDVTLGATVSVAVGSSDTVSSIRGADAGSVPIYSPMTRQSSNAANKSRSTMIMLMRSCPFRIIPVYNIPGQKKSGQVLGFLEPVWYNSPEQSSFDFPRKNLVPITPMDRKYERFVLGIELQGPSTSQLKGALLLDVHARQQSAPFCVLGHRRR